MRASGKKQPAWRPMDVFLASYVLHVIGCLSPDADAILASVAPKLKFALKTSASDWKGIVVERFALTKDVARTIRSEWRKSGGDPEAFASRFAARHRPQRPRTGTVADTPSC